MGDEFRCCFANIVGFFSGVETDLRGDVEEEDEEEALLESGGSLSNFDLESGGNLDSELSMLMDQQHGT